MNLQAQIENNVKAAFQVTYLALENESHQHAGSAEASHFKLTLVSADFDGLSKVKRHQAVYRSLETLMPQFHALALHTYSPAEWEAAPNVAASPNCQGGH